MKAIKSIIAVAVATIAWVTAEDLSAQSIKSPAFTQPLVEQWITIYNEVHPESQINMAAKGVTADIQIVVSRHQAEQLGQKTSAFGRVAILPFATEGSEAAETFGSRRLSKARLEHIYFNIEDEDDEFGDYADANKGMTIYSGNSQASVANTFAEYFGQSATAFRGKRIQGDDRFVNQAVSRDQKGLAFNALANLYDLETRQLKQGIHLLSLDVKRDVQKALEEGNLDTLLGSLEAESKNDAIATAEISLSYDAQNQEASQFISWVLTEGVRYNHQFGLLNSNQQLQANK